MIKTSRIKLLIGVPTAMLIGLPIVAGAETIELKEAIEAALETNPEINQAAMNKEAIEFERRQAQGLFQPRISVEASAGLRRLENNTRRVLGIADQTLYPIEADLSADQVIFDSGSRNAELKRQAARTDGAALRVEERSEFIALNVARQYLDYLLQQRIVAASDDNVTFHEGLTRDLREGVSKGSISIADQQQAEERLQAARVRKTEAEEDLVNAAIAFRTLTGLSIEGCEAAALARFVHADGFARCHRSGTQSQSEGARSHGRYRCSACSGPQGHGRSWSYLLARGTGPDRGRYRRFPRRDQRYPGPAGDALEPL